MLQKSFMWGRGPVRLLTTEFLGLVIELQGIKAGRMDRNPRPSPVTLASRYNFLWLYSFSCVYGISCRMVNSVGRDFQGP